MKRAIVDFGRDEQDDWFAWLVCGHRQHTRHNPPLESRPWVTTRAGRDAQIGRELECLRCDAFELPEQFEPYRTLQFTDESVPAGLLKDHNTKDGVWARIEVLYGIVTYVVPSTGFETELRPGDSIYVPPQLTHRVELADATFEVTFLKRFHSG